MKLRHIFLSVLAVSASIARYISSPFPTGSENPVVALMALNAPVLLWLAHGWYALMPGVVVFIGGTLFSGVWRCLVRVGTAQEAGQGGGCPRGRSADIGRETGHRRRGNASPHRGAGDSQPGLARHPGAGALYRSRDLRGGRLGEDLGLHAPVCPAIARLASLRTRSSGLPRWSSK